MSFYNIIESSMLIFLWCP